MELIFPLALLLLAASLYAVALSTPLGVRFTSAKTHYTVIAGVLLVLGCYALVDYRSAGIVLLFFVAGGLPMVARSEILDFRQRSLIERQARGDDQ